MTKKVLAVLLALALIGGAVPLVYAQSSEAGWLIYCENVDETAFAAVITAPADYTRLANARVEAVYPGGETGGVYTPAAEQVPFYYNGKTETRWTLTVRCPLPAEGFPGCSVQFSVLPGSLLNGAGKGNPRVDFTDETDYVPACGCAEIDFYSGLLLRDYPRAQETVAVGDTLRVDYSGLYPIEIAVNGERLAALPGGELQSYTRGVTETGALTVTVTQEGREIAARTVTVITSQEMYERNLRDGLITGEDIPGTQDLIEAGVPSGSPFIFVAKVIAFFNAVRLFLQRLFSFPRITN